MARPALTARSGLGLSLGGSLVLDHANGAPRPGGEGLGEGVRLLRIITNARHPLPTIATAGSSPGRTKERSQSLKGEDLEGQVAGLRRWGAQL